MFVASLKDGIFESTQGTAVWGEGVDALVVRRLPLIRQLATQRSARMTREAFNRMPGGVAALREVWPRAESAARLKTLRVGYMSADFGMTPS